MPEVIARKSKLYLVSTLLVILFALGAAVFFVVVYLCGDEFTHMPSWFYALIALPVIFLAVFAVVYIVFFIKYLRLPEALVVRDGSNLIFMGNTFAIADIKNIRYRHYNYRRFGRSRPSRDFGTLCITLKSGVEYKCPGVPAVEEVHDSIFALVCSRAAREDS